jgi:anion-transporting  ArsA/GET3 family ATPase
VSTHSRPGGRLEGWIEGKRVVVCAGSGGVGKTTTSAAIAAGTAARGARVAVLTIDPARRLADSLGLPELGNEARQVDPDALARAGLGGDGELWALTLDAKQTFDDLVARDAPDDQTREAVLGNRIYRELSSAVAGSQEYMAMEKLYELNRAGGYDLVVLDTPPTRNALDFLDAPRRLSRFVDSRSLALFRASGRTGLGIVGRGAAAMLSVLERATGVDLLRDLAEFLDAFGDMSHGFRDRAHAVEALLRAPETTFLLVSAPRAAAIDDAAYFHRKLAQTGMRFGGVVVNRVRMPVAATPGPALQTELAQLAGERLARKVVRTLDDHVRLADHDAANVERLRTRLGGAATIVVPELPGDVHDLSGLAAVDRHLFGGAAAG